MIIKDLHKAPVLIKEGVNSSEEFSGSGNNRFFVGLTLIPFLKVIIPEIVAVSLYGARHNPYNSSGMGVASFGDSQGGTEFTGLFEDWVKSAESHRVFVKGNSCPINLYETRRVQNKLLYEPLRSGKMVFHPLGLYFTNTVHIHKHNFINNII